MKEVNLDTAHIQTNNSGRAITYQREGENHNQNNEQRSKCNKTIIKLITISILLVIGIICFVFFVILRETDVFTPEKIKEEDSKNSSEISPDDSSKKEHIIISISDLSYKEIESLMGSKIIQKNHILINETLENINNMLLTCENSSLEIIQINPEISFSLPEFLENPTTPALKVAKSDIVLYKRKYEELILNINNLTNTAIEYFKNFCTSLNDMKDKINILLFQFEDTIKNHYIPIISEQKIMKINNNTNENKEIELRKLSINEQIEEFKNETDNLNLLYNQFFQYTNEETQIINDEINKLPILVNEFQDRIEGDISVYNENINDLSDPNDIQQIHNNLINIKSSFISTKDYFKSQQNYLDEEINTFENGYRDRQFKYEEFKTESDDIIENITISSNNIKNDIININENKTDITIPDINISSLIADHIIKSLDRTVQVIKEEKVETSERIQVFISIINVEEKTSLDLLFVMDITGSMEPYLEQAKENIINIINKILIECPGIDINLGFIGYRDILQTNNKDYVNIEFTKQYQKLQNSIKNVQASGGEGDGPEDVAWAIEMALNKNWKNNARFLIFIADAPCHGPKYHNNPTDKYPNGGPNRRNIEELIKELTENDISLFCMKITTFTDIMYNIFNDIYKSKTNCEFKIVSMSSGESLSDIVVNSAAEVYVSQRNVDI